LIARSDLLLLDEPTNHLDLDATLWLERWLQRYAGTLVIISHDRDFLDAVVNRIVRIEGDSLVSYSGNYSSYERIRAERLALQAAMAEKQRVRRSEVEAFVARFRYKASKARQAQSRLKELARMDEIAAAHVDSPFSFRFPDSPTGSGALLNLSQATLGYPGRTVLEGVNLELQPGARIGLLGANGAGKTTLIKTLTAELALVAGERIEGTRLRIGYFAQQQLEALDVAASPLLHLQRLPESGEERASEQKMRDFLGGFDFRGDAVEAPVRDFSGGEKARLALALIIWQRPNLLLLDEPTNHLDIDMRQALAEALNAYQGALVLISHDRHLLRNSVDQFYLVADGALQPFDGDLHDYQHRLAESSSAAAVAPAAVVAAPDRRADRQAAAQRRAELAPLRKQQQQIERQLQTLNEQLEAVEQWLSAPDAYSDDNRAALKAKLAEQGEWRRQLHSAEETWLEIAAILEQN
jgi:ATP-binding cassette subfamily F protein 3